MPLTFREAKELLQTHPPTWGAYLASRYFGCDRIGEPGATSNPSRLKNYAFPLSEVHYYTYVMTGHNWLGDYRLRFTRRGLRPPAHQRWIHYILPDIKTSLPQGSTCGSAGDNVGTPVSFRDSNLFQLFPAISGHPDGLIERHNAWGGSLLFRRADNPNAVAYSCWQNSWAQRTYQLRWLNMPQAFWDAVLASLCERSGTDSPCCNRNVVGVYIDAWNQWFSFVRGGAPAGSQSYTPILSADRYTTAQAHEAFRQLVHQVRYIMRELDAAREDRPSDYSPEVVVNTYNCAHLSVSTNANAYTNAYLIPKDNYIRQNHYVNMDSSGYPFYTNPDRRPDGILIEEMWWYPHETQRVDGTPRSQSAIYVSRRTSGQSYDARLLLALRHGLKVHILIPHAVSKDDYEQKVIQIAEFWNAYRTRFPGQIIFGELNHSAVPYIEETSTNINFVPYNGDLTDRRAGYPQPVSRLLRWDYDRNPQFRPIKLTLNDGEAQ